MHVARLAGLLIAATAGTACAGDDESLTLYHRARIAFDGSVSTLSIDLDPSAWRVGTPDGPSATAAQLRAVLAGLEGVDVLGRCTGRTLARPSRVCAFSINDPEFVGIVNPDLKDSVYGWAATPTTGPVTMRYFGLLAPERLVGVALTGESGLRLAWRLHAEGPHWPPAALDPATALLVLHNDPLGAEALLDDDDATPVPRQAASAVALTARRSWLIPAQR